jgi:hypothetical protein
MPPTVQATRTSLDGESVLNNATRFFSRQNTLYPVFPEKRGTAYATFRGQGGEELIIGVLVVHVRRADRAVLLDPATSMTTPFVTSLRARPGTVVLGDGMTIRVEMPEVWDTVRIQTPANEPVSAIKEAALEALYPNGASYAQFVMKLNGYEVLDESLPLSQTGALDGSTFLLTFRRRRPVRS